MSTNKVGKVILNKHPGPAKLCSREQATLDALSNFFRMHLEKRAGLNEVERVHMEKQSLIEP